MGSVADLLRGCSNGASWEGEGTQCEGATRKCLMMHLRGGAVSNKACRGVTWTRAWAPVAMHCCMCSHLGCS